MYRTILSYIVIIGCAVGLSARVTRAQDAGGNGGILYGPDHAFGFRAPKGWVLDNQSGVEQGLDAVFYPVGQTWKDSPVMAYARARARTAKIKTAADAVHDTLDDMHRHGNTNSQAKKADPIPINKTQTAQVYYYTGDKWGNYEAVAYICETKTINFFVLNSRTRKEFDHSLSAFRSLVKSYIYMGDSPLIDKQQKPSENNKQ